MTTTAAKIEPQHPPLARDLHGNAVAFPDGTAAWRICRQTTGRPREIVGHDKQVLRFPLETTCDELVSMCGRDVYRVYALDEVGKQLDYVTTLDLTGEVRELRNAGEVPASRALAPLSMTPTSDLRFALEAITQMMRTNSEALRTVADSQVDLAKALAAAKGIRNASFYAPPQVVDEDDDVDEADYPPAAAPKGWVDLLLPAIQELAKAVPAMMVGKAMLPSATAPKVSGEAAEGEEDLASRPSWEMRDFLDLQYAARKAQAKKAAREAPPAAATLATLQSRITNDPALMQQLFAIKAQLSSEEIETLLGAVARSSESEQLSFIDSVKALPTEQAVALCRELVVEIRGGESHGE
jgi:hypothetical protein